MKLTRIVYIKGLKPLCDTTMTPRNPRTSCDCATYEENMGPCDTFDVGENGNCVYCDHAQRCHSPTVH